jgi:hypothetical protein
MPRIEINTPFETDQPRITVEVDANAPLARGRHNYQLEVVDDSGNVSAPDRVVVIVADRTRPTAVLTGPRIVDVGRSFDLSGEQSFDIGGVVRTWRFTYLGPEIIT